jgi:hypothetical protein
MSQQNGFGSGFILGSVVGGVVGGLLGTVLATRNEKRSLKLDDNKFRRDREIFSSEESIELARHGLEDKIAQLNLAIDDVRQQLGKVETSEE